MTSILRSHERRLATRAVALAALTVLVTSAAARAEGPPSGPPPGPTSNASLDPTSLFGADKPALTLGAGVGLLDEDWYVQIRPNVDFAIGPVGLGLSLPLNLLVWENLPPGAPSQRDQKTHFSVVRKADFPTTLDLDTIAHYLSFIRYVRWGKKTEPLYLHYGLMFSQSMGHGSIVDRYNNTLDPTTQKAGFAFDMNFKEWGFETLIDNIVATEANLIGVRGYVKPFAFGDGMPILDMLAVGLSVTTDISAPRRLQYLDEPAQTSGCAPSCLELDANGNPIVTTALPVVVWGLDLELQLLRTSILSITPYVDVNNQMTHNGGGTGLHAGVMANFSFPLFVTVNLWSKLEYRLMDPGYIPNYFDQAYDVQRYLYPVGDVLVPKGAAKTVLAPNGNGGLAGLRHGIYGEAAFDFLGVLQVGANLFGTPGVVDSNNLMVFLTVPTFEVVKFNGYYMKKNFDQVIDVIAIDEKSLASISALFQVFGPIYAGGTYTRRWQLSDEGALAAIDDFQFGVQTYFPF